MPNSKHNKKFLITGASGYIGSNFVELLIEENCEVLLLSRNPEKLKNYSWFNKVNFIECDYKLKIPKINNLSNYYMIHFAWDKVSDYLEPSHLTNDFPAHFIFLTSLLKNGLNKLCVIGSCYEYGLYDGAIHATAAPKPVTYYGLAKHTLHQSLLLMKAYSKFDLLWLRPFYIYGKNHSSRSLFGLLDYAKNNKLNEFNMSHGDQLRDYLHINDAVSEIYNKIKNETSGQFNICSEKPTSVKDLVLQYISKENIKLKLNTGYYDYPVYEPKNFWGIK